MPEVDLSVDLGRGLVLPNPVGLASGTAGYGFELRDMIDLDALGALYSKGTTPEARPGNAPPRVAEVRGGMLNSIGLHNPGVDHVTSVYAPQFATWRIPVVVNVAGGTVEDYVHCVQRLEGVAGVAGIELNISCPNIAHGLDFGRDPAAAARVVAAVRAISAMHLMVKLSPNAGSIADVAKAVEDAGADSISAVNTYIGMKVYLGEQRPVLPRGIGGMSGPAIKPLAIAAVAAVRGVVSIPVIGVGGITTATDALEYFVAGADAVQVGTASFVRPATALDVLEGLRGHVASTGRPLTSLRWSATPA